MRGAGHRKISIPPAILEQLISHCRACLPEEGCGILAGTGSAVSHIFPMKNIEASPVSYLMDPQEQFDVMKRMRVSKLEMIAIYHSHPDSPAIPSRKDIERAFYDETACLIVSFADKTPLVKAYRIVSGSASETEIERTPDA